MAVKIYEVKIKVPKGMPQWIQVQANSINNARQMVEAQYGKGCILGGPKEVREGGGSKRTGGGTKGPGCLAFILASALIGLIAIAYNFFKE